MAAKRLTQRARGDKYTPRDWYKPFLSVLSEWANVRDAAAAARVSRQAAYKARDADERFAEAWLEAERDAADRLRRAAWELALGLYGPSSDDGRPDSHVLTWLLRFHDPLYKEVTRHEVSGPDGAPVRFTIERPTRDDAD